MKNIKYAFIIFLGFSFVNNVFSENQLYDISNELMCPVCQGQTVAESNSQLALSMKEVIKIKISEGKSKKEILDYFITQYGETILAKPPIKGFNLILWILPPIILILSLVFWVFNVRGNKRRNNKN